MYKEISDKLGISFETADRTLPAKDIVAGYYRRYEDHFGLNVHRPVDATSVENRGADLVVQHTEGETATQVLVNATGTWGAPFVPYYPGVSTFRGRHVHTNGYIAAEEFRGQNVVVVGGGTSAVGFLLELEDVAATVYHHLGIDARNVHFADGLARPMALLETGTPVRELTGA